MENNLNYNTKVYRGCDYVHLARRTNTKKERLGKLNIKKQSKICTKADNTFDAWKEISFRIIFLVTGKAVNLEYFDLEIAVRAERRIIERSAAVRFPEAYIFVHP